MLKGVVEVISRKPTYGYDITQQLKKLGFEVVVEGTVYTILVRLEKNGFVDIEKKPSEVGPPRKFYSLTEAGTDELAIFWKNGILSQVKLMN